MVNSERRRFLKGLLGALAGAAGTVVLATTNEAPKVDAGEASAEPPTNQPADIQERAEQIANAAGADEQDVPVSAFVNGGFANGGGGGFRNGGFANGGGGFRNGGFANGGGGFRNGGFANGAGGGFRNGAFRNY
jgi:hypothetical protein